MNPMSLRAHESCLSWLGQLCVISAIVSLALPVPPAVLVLCIAMGGGLLLADDRQLLGQRDRATLVLVGLFLLLSALSLSLSRNFERSWMASLSMIPAVFLGMLVGFKLSAVWLRQLRLLCTLMSLFMSLYLLIIVFLHPASAPSEWFQLAGYRIFSVPNDVLFLVLLSPFPISLLFYGPGWSKKTLGIATLVSMAAICVLFNSRTGVVLLGLAVAAMLLRLRLKLFVLAMLGLSALFVSVDFLNDFSVLAKFQSFWTASSRIPLWLAAWQMFLDAPLVGLGPGAFSEYYQSYVAALALPDWVVLDSRHMPWVHNLYLEILAERGVLALGIVSLIFVRIIGILLRERKASLESGLLVQACLVSLGLVLVAGLFELSFLRLWFASYFFLMIGAVLFISSEGTENGIETD